MDTPHAEPSDETTALTNILTVTSLRNLKPDPPN